MNDKLFEEAIEKAYLKLSAMGDNEFKKLLLKNENGDYAQIVRATNFPDIEDYENDLMPDIENDYQPTIFADQYVSTGSIAMGVSLMGSSIALDLSNNIPVQDVYTGVLVQDVHTGVLVQGVGKAGVLVRDVGNAAHSFVFNEPSREIKFLRTDIDKPAPGGVEAADNYDYALAA